MNGLNHRQRTCDGYFPNSIWPISYLGYMCVLGLNTKAFCRKNIKSMFPCFKLVLIIQPKIPQMPQNLSAQFVCPSPKIWDIIENRLHRASVANGLNPENLKKSKSLEPFLICQLMA